MWQTAYQYLLNKAAIGLVFGKVDSADLRVKQARIAYVRGYLRRLGVSVREIDVQTRGARAPVVGAGWVNNAHYFAKRDRLEVYGATFASAPLLNSVLRHEAMHVRWARVRRAYYRQRAKNGPIFKLLRPFFEEPGLSRLSAAGGVSEYSNLFWQRYRKRHWSYFRDSAMIETLADMASDGTGRANELWKRFYAAVLKAYGMLD